MSTMSATAASARTKEKTSKAKPAKKKDGEVQLLFASVLDIAIDATMTLTSDIDPEDEVPAPEDKEDTLSWDDPDNRVGVVVTTEADGLRVLKITANCSFDFYKRDVAERVRHRCLVKGRFRLERESASIEDGNSLELAQVWPYMSMVLWRVRDHASEQLARFAQVKLGVKLPEAKDFERSDD